MAQTFEQRQMYKQARDDRLRAAREAKIETRRLETRADNQAWKTRQQDLADRRHTEGQNYIGGIRTRENAMGLARQKSAGNLAVENRKQMGLTRRDSMEFGYKGQQLGLDQRAQRFEEFQALRGGGAGGELGMPQAGGAQLSYGDAKTQWNAYNGEKLGGSQFFMGNSGQPGGQIRSQGQLIQQPIPQQMRSGGMINGMPEAEFMRQWDDRTRGQRGTPGNAERMVQRESTSTEKSPINKNTSSSESYLPPVQWTQQATPSKRPTPWISAPTENLKNKIRTFEEDIKKTQQARLLGVKKSPSKSKAQEKIVQKKGGRKNLSVAKNKAKKGSSKSQQPTGQTQGGRRGMSVARNKTVDNSAYIENMMKKALLDRKKRWK